MATTKTMQTAASAFNTLSRRATYWVLQDDSGKAMSWKEMVTNQSGAVVLEHASDAPANGGLAQQPPWADEYHPPDTASPATSLRDLLTAERGAVHVFSADHALINTARTAAGEQYPLLRTESYDQLLDAIRTGQCGIVLLDADTAPLPLEELIAALEATGKPLVLMVATARLEAADGLRALGSKVHGVILKPSSADFIRLRLVSAVDRWFELRSSPHSNHRAGREPLRTARRHRLMLGAVGALLAVVLGGLYLGSAL